MAARVPVHTQSTAKGNGVLELHTWKRETPNGDVTFYGFAIRALGLSFPLAEGGGYLKLALAESAAEDWVEALDPRLLNCALASEGVQ